MRPVLSGATGIVAVPGTVAVMIALIGTTSFDGFSQGPTWNSLAPDLQQRLVDLGVSQETALQIAFTIGMAAVLAVVAGLYRLGTVGMRSIDARHGAGELGARFAHSLLPIALAYVVAHYFSYLAVQGQAIGYLASDPLGDGANLFGTATASIDYGFVTANAVWYVQVGALIVGHVSRARARARPRAHDLRQRSGRHPLAVLDAHRDGGLHVPGALAAERRSGLTVVLAHVGHWYAELLYVAPVVLDGRLG